MRVTSHVRGDLWAATLVLVPGLGAWSSVPCWSRLLPQSLLSDIPPPWLGLPPPSWPLKPPPSPWLLGSRYSPPSLEGPRGGYGFSETPPGALSLVLTQGKGCVWQKQLYKYGCRGGAPPKSLGEFADDANQGCVLILEPLVVSAEVGQGLQFLLQFGCLSLQGPALESL